MEIEIPFILIFHIEESFPNAQSTVQTATTVRRISGISGSPLQHPLLAGRPPSAAAQLQRSHSDALDPVRRF
jgi:hypothetical protein